MTPSVEFWAVLYLGKFYAPFPEVTISQYSQIPSIDMFVVVIKILFSKLNWGIATLEDSLTVSHKTKHTLTIQASNHAPWYLPKGVENLRPHKNLHMVFIKFIAALFIVAKDVFQ